MTPCNKLGVLLLAGIALLFVFDLGERASIPGMHSLVSTAEAVVGRPLTPVSIAGATRRTARRCAAGVYNC